MPLGSIAEWRARIGSSWCALGQSFKTRSPFRHAGARRLQTPLTLNQVMSMTMILIMFTAINLALRIVWTTDHHRAYLGFIASWMIQNLIIIGPDNYYLYPSLYCIINILPLLPVLRDLGWKPNQQRNSKHSTLLQFFYIVVALLETTHLTATSVIFYRLLQSGDVEQNPGPDLDYDSIDSEKVLDEDDLLDVMEELTSLDSSCYYKLGIGLRLRTSELDSIESSFKNDPERALTKVVTAWLQKHHNVEKFGPPTWRMLVKAINSRAGGNNSTLAQKVASNHPAKGGLPVTIKETMPGVEVSEHDDLLNISNLREVLDEMWDYRARWRFIGIEWGINAGTLAAIEADHKTVDDCIVELITIWLNHPKDSPKPTRSAIKAALQSKHLFIATAYDSNTGANKFNLVNYKGYLKSLYKVKSQSCYLGEDHWPPPVTEKVFQLAMIKAEEVKRMKLNIEDEFVRQTITGKVDDILKRKVPIELKNIFVSVKEGEQRKVLIEGAPGCGKSTLSLYICHEWTKGNLFQEYNHIILVQLRELSVQNAKKIVDLLPRRDDIMGHVKHILFSPGKF